MRMTSDDTTWLDATELAALVRSGEATPLELVDEAIARIERINPSVNAVVHERFDAAREEAASERLPDGPLRGVPFLLKDLGQMVEGEPYTLGWTLLKESDSRGPVTTHVAKKLIDSGVVRLGSSAAPELGASAVSVETRAYGATRNPWNLNRVVGASSGGAAAAVASGMVPIAHGNDAGGSIRIPAAFCGVVGMKPSRGRTSLGPLQGEALGASQEEGVLARSVRDVALGLDIVRGNVAGDPFIAPTPERNFREEIGVDPGRLRIGVARSAPNDLAPFSVDAQAALARAVSLVVDLGHEIHESYPDVLDDKENYRNWMTVFSSTFAAGIELIEQQIGQPLSPDSVEPFTWEVVQQGRRYSAIDYVKYFDWRNDVSRRAAQWWEAGHDILVLPTTSAVAPPLGEWKLREGEHIVDALRRTFDFVPFTQMWNATGQPAISLPLHITPEGLPLGVTFVAPYGREDLLFRLASQIETAAPWKDMRPPVA